MVRMIELVCNFFSDKLRLLLSILTMMCERVNFEKLADGKAVPRPEEIALLLDLVGPEVAAE